jgi:hypothetical protein
MLDQNSGLKQTHILLEKPLINISCSDQIDGLKRDRTNVDMTNSKQKKEKYERNFTIRTKTGNCIELFFIYLSKKKNQLIIILVKVIKSKQVQQHRFIFNYSMIKINLPKIFV